MSELQLFDFHRGVITNLTAAFIRYSFKTLCALAHIKNIFWNKKGRLATAFDC
jgi:hypothetical protein